ncbi:hypothetical protein HXX76_015145 [Chlamydomonas incerta]|uniref:Uncharacterized protein n=1 Tax=Chlamydomonas incerta TaxID=51695 RepID=A0A835VRX9_CHLIN|nr:hypothetical protein HXX76_015145 [Chlamydomonas incerta]|eukprot:KAG2423628.1 hypothetical protein HXX76_015145 [Chlamydomonas incerta]
MTETSTQCPFLKLTPDLIRHIADSPGLHPNEVAISLKLTCTATAQSLKHRRGVRLTWTRTDVTWPQAPLADQPWPGAEFVRHFGRPEPWRRLARSQRQLLLCLAASSLHGPSLEAALEHCGAAVTADVVAAAAAAGDLAACEALLLRAGADWFASAVVQTAARYGHLHICTWAAEQVECGLRPGRRPPNLLPLNCDPDAIAKAAARGGHEHVLDWVRAAGGPSGVRTAFDAACAAAEGGRVEALAGLSTQLTAPGQRLALLPSIAYGCPRAVLAAFWADWEHGTGGGAGASGLSAGGAAVQLLLAAVLSPTPDWAAKADWLLAAWGPERLQQWTGPVGALMTSNTAAAAAAASERVRAYFMAAATATASAPSPGSRSPGSSYAARLQYLARRGLGLPDGAGLAAAYAGDGAAAELFLDELLATAVQWWGAPPQWRRSVDAMARAAVRAGSAGVLAALRRRWGAVAEAAVARQLAATKPDPRAGGSVKDWSREWRFRGGPAVAWLLDLDLELGAQGEQERPCAEQEGEQAEAPQAGAGAEAAHEEPAPPPPCWSHLFKLMAVTGCDLELLRRLHRRQGQEEGQEEGEGGGAGLDPEALEALACGGSVEQLEWAAEQAAAAGVGGGGGGLQPLSAHEFENVLLAGNWAAADWLLARGLAPPPPQLRETFMRLTGATSTATQGLRWLAARAEAGAGTGGAEVAVVVQRLGALALNAVGAQAAWLQEMLRQAVEPVVQQQAVGVEAVGVAAVGVAAVGVAAVGVGAAQQQLAAC